MQKTIHHWISLLTIIALFAYAQTAAAQTVAFSTFGSNASYSPITGDYSGTGNGTHLGSHTFSGKVMTIPMDPCDPFETDFYWISTQPQETVAADGSKIFFDASGTVELIGDFSTGIFTACWTGEFVVVPGMGTGRFANAGPADEPLSVVAINDPFNIFLDPIWTFSWTLTGQIDLGKKKKK